MTSYYSSQHFFYSISSIRSAQTFESFEIFVVFQVQGTITTSSSFCSPSCWWEPGCSTAVSCVSDLTCGVLTVSGTVLHLHWIHMPALCMFFRLVDSLRAALRGSGPVGRGLCPGQLLSLGARRLPAGLLSHLLVRNDLADAALPGDGLLGLCQRLSTALKDPMKSVLGLKLKMKRDLRIICPYKFKRLFCVVL